MVNSPEAEHTEDPAEGQTDVAAQQRETPAKPRRRGNLLSSIVRVFKEPVMMLMPLFFVSGAGTLLFHVSNIQTELADSSAMESSSIYTTMTREYLSVVEDIDNFEFVSVRLVKSIADEIEEAHPGTKLELVSASRIDAEPVAEDAENALGRNFTRDAYAAFQENPEASFHRFDYPTDLAVLSEGTNALRYAEPLTVNGDVKAVIQVTYPMDSSMEMMNLIKTSALIFVFSVLGLVGLNIVYDSARRRAEEALLDSEHRFKSVAESTGVGIISMAGEGAIVSWNYGASQIFWYEEAEILGQDIDRVIPRFHEHLEKLKTLLADMQGVDNTTFGTIEMQGQKKDGELFPIEVSLGSWQTEKEHFFSAVITDISNRKELEAQLIQSQKLESVGTLAAGVAHEINNPTAFIMINIETMTRYFARIKKILKLYKALGVILKKDSPESAKRAAAVVERVIETEKLDAVLEDIDDILFESHDGTERIKTIVEQLSGFTRVASTEPEDVDVNKCLDTTLKFVQSELKYKCEVVKEYGDIPMIQGFRTQLTQVFINIIMNAAQAIEERGTIRLKTLLEGRDVVIRISDDGAGMPEKVRERIFEPFFTTKTTGSGTGLGLSISYDIIQKHSGIMEVTSEEGVGTTFVIRLPAKVLAHAKS